jgi:hypothetical protein
LTCFSKLSSLDQQPDNVNAMVAKIVALRIFFEKFHVKGESILSMVFIDL